MTRPSTGAVAAQEPRGFVLMKKVTNCTVVDVFAGAGGLTHGFALEGFQVAAGIDADIVCQYPYSYNNPGAQFIHAKIEDVKADTVLELYPEDHIKVLVGCAPCQPFSAYTRKQEKHENWNLLYSFAQLVEDVQPDIISMENVPRLKTYEEGKVFYDFLALLNQNGYHINWDAGIYAPDYGVPQHRYRLILIASKFGKVAFLRRSHTPDRYRTVRDAIGKLELIEAGQTSTSDPLHFASTLSQINLKRIRASAPGGTWHDWPDELRATCHTKPSGKWYRNVYGRMIWDEPAPTITTQCYGFGNGRFGHPEQDRAISLREAALIQSFPKDYQFSEPGTAYHVSAVTRLIGNAVPVDLARMIAKSIRLHISRHRGWLWREP